jgi:hypothetical protein
MSKLLVSAAAHRGGLAAASPGREVVERNELRALQLLLATPTSGGLSILATGLDAIVERRRVADRAGRRELRHYPALGVRSGHAVAARGLVAARAHGTDLRLWLWLRLKQQRLGIGRGRQQQGDDDQHAALLTPVL